MQEHTVDLLTIPFYQQMAQVFYVDRGMMKWAGMLLSEHNVQIMIISRFQNHLFS